MLSNDKKYSFSVLGELQKDTGDDKSFEALKVVIYNYNNFLIQMSIKDMKYLLEFYLIYLIN